MLKNKNNTIKTALFWVLFHIDCTFVRKTPPFSEARSNKYRINIEQNPHKIQENRQM
jgi:hypothetical protein